MNRSSIEWTQFTSNPIRVWNKQSGKRGTFCVHASAGCERCYSERHNVWRGSGLQFIAQNVPHVEWELNEAELRRWRRLQPGDLVFAFDMTDVFLEHIPLALVERCFAEMALSLGTFQLLTKRAARMRELLSDTSAGGFADRVCREAARLSGDPRDAVQYWPLPNVWLGVSAEDQKNADARIPHLLDTPAAVRFLSAEPLLGALDLTRWLEPIGIECPDVCPGRRYVKVSEAGTGELHHHGETECYPLCPDCGIPAQWTGYDPGLDWVITGGESGPGARPMDVTWVRSLRDQCQSGGVPLFVKQLGAFSIWPTEARDADGDPLAIYDGRDFRDGYVRRLLKDKKGGDPAEWPADLRVRQLPDPRPLTPSPATEGSPTHA